MFFSRTQILDLGRMCGSFQEIKQKDTQEHLYIYNVTIYIYNSYSVVPLT